MEGSWRASEPVEKKRILWGGGLAGRGTGNPPKCLYWDLHKVVVCV